MDLEIEYDKLLKIHTNGRDDSKANYVNFPYEPTPYVVLERLANSGYLTKKDKIIDYGSGKGRVDFFLAYQAKVKMIGVEYDEFLYQLAQNNKKNALSSHKVEFININACDYIPPTDLTGAYFFNPFSVKVLDKVLKILEKCAQLKLFFYYPSKSYEEYLEECVNLKMIDKIDCTDLFSNVDERECILVYEMINKKESSAAE